MFATFTNLYLTDCLVVELALLSEPLDEPPLVLQQVLPVVLQPARVGLLVVAADGLETSTDMECLNILKRSR